MNTIVRLSKSRYTRTAEVSLTSAIYALSQEVDTYEGPLIQILSVEKGTLHDIYANKDGTLDTATLEGHALGDAAYVVTWYDQNGNYNATQSDSTKRPLIVDGNGLVITQNGEPALLFDNVNDNLYANVPYQAGDEAVTVLTLYTRDTNAESDAIITSDPANRGIWLFNNTANKSAVFTYRDTGIIAIAADATPQNQTVCHGVISTRGDTDKVFNDGELVASAKSKEADINMPTQIVIGASGAGSSASGSKIQCVAFWRNDQSSNMERYSQEWKSRYDSTVENVNNKILFSSSPVLLPTGEYANGRLVGGIRFSEQIKVFPWKNRNAGGFGDFEIINNKNEYNYVTSAGFTDVEILQYDGYTLTDFGKGEVDNIGYSPKGRIKVSIKSVLDKLKVELPTGRFDSTYPDLENEKKRLVLGQANLIEPRLLNASTNKYHTCDNLHAVPSVYDSGLPVLFTQDAHGFTLSQNPSGRILAVVQGHSKTGGGYEEHIKEHIERLLSEVDVDYNPSELANIWPGITSSWSGTNENVIDAITELLDGFISYVYADSSGTLRFGRLNAPTSPVSQIYEREILTEPVVFKDRAQGLSEELLNSRNFNPYTPDQIAFTASQANKINFVKEYRRTSVSTGLHYSYKNSNIQMKSQSLGGQTNGMTILNYIISLWSQVRKFYTITTYRNLELNNVYQVFHSKKELQIGKNLLLIGKERSSKTRKVTYTMWG